MSKCMNEDCSNELKGKQQRFCSDKCRKAVSRTKLLAEPGQTQPGHEVGQSVTSPSRLLSQGEIDSLPQGVSKPFSGQTDWTDSETYEHTICNLIDLTLAELASIKQWVPNWRKNMGEKYVQASPQP